MTKPGTFLEMNVRKKPKCNNCLGSTTLPYVCTTDIQSAYKLSEEFAKPYFHKY